MPFARGIISIFQQRMQIQACHLHAVVRRLSLLLCFLPLIKFFLIASVAVHLSYLYSP